MVLEMLYIWLVMAVITAMVGKSKGGSFFLYLLAGLLIWPVALTHAILKEPREKRDRRKSKLKDVEVEPLISLPSKVEKSVDSRVSDSEAEFFKKATFAKADVDFQNGVPYFTKSNGYVVAFFENKILELPTKELLFDRIKKTTVEFNTIEEFSFSDWDKLPGKPYPSQVVGIAYDNPDGGSRSAYVRRKVRDGQMVVLVRDRNNAYDPNAVAVFHRDTQIGFTPARHNWISAAIDEGGIIAAIITDVDVSEDPPSVAIEVKKIGAR